MASPTTPQFASNLQIFVNTPTGKTITLDVRGDDKIDYIKAMILVIGRYPVVAQKLVFEGQELIEGKTLAEYSIQKGAVLRSMSGMQIFVKTLTGKTLCIDVECGDFIEDVKCVIMDNMPSSEGNDILQQRIVFDGNTLLEGSTLANNSIGSFMTVSMAPPRLRCRHEDCM